MWGRLDAILSAPARDARASRSSARVLLMLPFLLAILFILTLAIPGTRGFADWLLGENHSVELRTFACFLSGDVIVGGSGGVVSRVRKVVVTHSLIVSPTRSRTGLVRVRV